MMKTHTFLYFFFFLFFNSCQPGHQHAMKEKHQLIFIHNGNTRVGILTDVGGRIVYASLEGEKNILKSDSALWYENKEEKPEISAYSDFKAYNGHIVWVGPQKEWWSHQRKNLYRKFTKAIWPPDTVFNHRGLQDNSSE